MTYAKNTTVAPEKSRAEIERILTRYGAKEFGYMTMAKSAAVAFSYNDRRVRFDIPLPQQGDYYTTRAHEQAICQRWRALSLVVKAKLEAVESEITTFDDEFMAHMVMPNGRLLREIVIPQIERAASSGQMPALMLLAGGDGV